MVARHLTLHLTHWIHFQYTYKIEVLFKKNVRIFWLDWDASLTRRRVWLRETVSESVIFQQHPAYVRASLCGSLIKAQQRVLIKRIGLLWLIPCVTCNVLNSMNHGAAYTHAWACTQTHIYFSQTILSFSTLCHLLPNHPTSLRCFQVTAHTQPHRKCPPAKNTHLGINSGTFTHRYAHIFCHPWWLVTIWSP